MIVLFEKNGNVISNPEDYFWDGTNMTETMVEEFLWTLQDFESPNGVLLVDVDRIIQRIFPFRFNNLIEKDLEKVKFRFKCEDSDIYLTTENINNYFFWLD